jgi:hypothetical protein
MIVVCNIFARNKIQIRIRMDSVTNAYEASTPAPKLNWIMLLYYEFALPKYCINNTRFEELEFCSTKLSS